MVPSTGGELGLSPLRTGKAWLFLIAVKRYAPLHSRCPTSAIFTVNGEMTTPENNTQYPTTSQKNEPMRDNVYGKNMYFTVSYFEENRISKWNFHLVYLIFFIL